MSAVAELYSQAIGYHRSGALEQAAALYRQIIQADPAHVDALHLLGVLAYQTRNYQNALAILQQVIALKPNHADAHINLGLVYKELGQAVLAIDCFRQALSINPNHGGAYYNLGLALHEQGQFAEAITAYQQAVRINPNHADALNNLGAAHFAQKLLEDAIRYYRQALAASPNHGNALNNLGVALKDYGQLADAIACYRNVLRMHPNYADAHNNLGVALREQGNLTEARGCYRQALAINPGHVDAHNSLGHAFYLEGRTAEALACYRQALAINPNHAEAHNNLGIAYFRQGQLAEATACFAQTLRADAGHKMAVWNRSLLRLLQGDYEGGWIDYEQRWAQPGLVPRTFKEPRWDGTPLEGKTILVYAEQGLGDTIMFARYLPMVQKRGATVVLECQPALMGLLVNSAGVNQLCAIGTQLPPFDVQIPLLSLPGLFGTTLTTIPADVPYLNANPRLVEHWRKELSPLIPHPSPLKIGIAWQGNPKNSMDRNRSLPLKHFEKLASIEGVQLISLQTGSAAEQIATAPFPVTDLGSRFDPNSLDDLAATLMNVDLVITVCTAVAHLAGAMSVPAWVALSFAADWRWLLDRSDSPWYPTLRLFRQTKLGEWDSVFARMTAEIPEAIRN